MAYESPAALRQALETRLGNRSRETGTDLERLRRRAAFERLLVRLELGAPHRWVVKGGMALEIRLGDRARSTRDLDLALRDVQGDGSAVRELLIDCLSVDREEDGFEFLVGEPTTITLEEAGRPGWRFSVESRMAGRTFANVRLDVVARDDEVAKTLRVELPGVLTSPVWSGTTWRRSIPRSTSPRRCTHSRGPMANVPIRACAISPTWCF